MKAFTAPLLELAEFDTIQKTKYREPGMIQIAGSTGSQKGHLAYALAREDRRVLYVVQDEERQRRSWRNTSFWMPGSFSTRQRIFCFTVRISGEISDSEEDGSDSGASEEEKVTVVRQSML